MCQLQRICPQKVAEINTAAALEQVGTVRLQTVIRWVSVSLSERPEDDLIMKSVQLRNTMMQLNICWCFACRSFPVVRFEASVVPWSPILLFGQPIFALSAVILVRKTSFLFGGSAVTGLLSVNYHWKYWSVVGTFPVGVQAVMEEKPRSFLITDWWCCLWFLQL